MHWCVTSTYSIRTLTSYCTYLWLVTGECTLLLVAWRPCIPKVPLVVYLLKTTSCRSWSTPGSYCAMQNSCPAQYSVGGSSQVFVSSLIDLLVGYRKQTRLPANSSEPRPITLQRWTTVLQSTVEHGWLLDYVTSIYVVVVYN